MTTPPDGKGMFDQTDADSSGQGVSDNEKSWDKAVDPTLDTDDDGIDDDDDDLNGDDDEDEYEEGLLGEDDEDSGDDPVKHEKD